MPAGEKCFPGAADSMVRTAGVMRTRGGSASSAVQRVARLALNVLKLQLLIVLSVSFWPIPFALFFYWLLYVWFGCEGTSMVAFTGLR